MYYLKYVSGHHKYPDMFDDEEWSFLNDHHSVKFKAVENILVLNIFREVDYGQKVNDLLKNNEELQDRIIKEMELN